MPYVMAESEIVLGRFNRLIQDLFRENANRNCFYPWEIELLLDIQSCNLRPQTRKETLRRYQKVVQHQLECGASTLLKLSEFLEKERARRRPSYTEARPAASEAGEDSRPVRGEV
jgi:hypothetical protein